MKPEDEELEMWTKEWQSLGGRDGLAQELSARVTRDAKRIRRSVVTELAGAAFSTALGAWLVVKTQGSVVVVVVVAGILVFNGVWLTRLLTLRENESRGLADGVEGFVALTRRRADNDMRWNRFARDAMLVLGALIVPWSVWAYLSRREAYDAAPWRGIVGFGTAFVILAAVFVFNQRRRRLLEADRTRFERLVDERTLPLGAPDDAA